MERRFLLALLTSLYEPGDFEEPVEIRRLDGVDTWVWPELRGGVAL